jgi:rubrerythrin
MRRFYEASDRIEAQRLVDYLQDHAIPAVILGDYLNGAAGDLAANIFPAVWLVEDVHWLRAHALLEEFLRPADEADSWVCKDCGERVEGVFEVCWNCGSHRPE